MKQSAPIEKAVQRTAGIDLDDLEAKARAATPQNIDSAEDVSQPTGVIECPECGGEGTVELSADYCNYDGKAMGVQFYGIGPEHLAAEAYFRAANPATILALIALARRSQQSSAAGPSAEQVRNDALEDAAKICAAADKSKHPADLTDAIRALKSAGATAKSEQEATSRASKTYAYVNEVVREEMSKTGYGASAAGAGSEQARENTSEAYWNHVMDEIADKLENMSSFGLQAQFTALCEEFKFRAPTSPSAGELAPAANTGSRVLMDQWNAGAALLLFQEWKGYPLPEFNADGNFDRDWLHREWVAFQAGLKRRAPATSAGELADERAKVDVCAEMRELCSSCGGTGDVHSLDGEWRGECNCPEGVSIALERLKIAAKKTQIENEELRAALAQQAGAPAPTGADEQTVAARDVLAERRRQVEQEGWHPEDDDRYTDCELSRAAAAYILQGDHNFGPPPEWPWAYEWWKPSNERRNMVKGLALGLAEIERLDRAAMAATQPKGGIA